MESLYSKLNEKYTKLKTQRDCFAEKIFSEQEKNFKDYFAGVDELLERSKRENMMLQAQIEALRTEVTLFRSKDKQYAESQKLLSLEIEKNRELSEEIERLQELDREGTLSSARDHEIEKVQSSVPITKMTRKRRKLSMITIEEDRIDQPSSSEVEIAMLIEQPKNLLTGTAVDVQEPNCCRRNIDGSGNTGCGLHLFQAIVERLVGMKLSTVNENEGVFISAIHHKSGLSFSLTCINKGDEDEAEILYRMSSLGTFERLAPEWMKEEVIMFSTSMCPIFFERVSRVINPTTV